MRKLLGSLLLGTIAGVTWCQAAVANNYPEHPIKLIVPYPPGSGTDTVARYTAKRLEEKLSQTIVVENRPGGNAIIAAQAVIQSKPDGYTLLWAANGPVTTNVALHKKLPYDPLTDLAPVARLALSPMGLYVPAKSPYKSATELLNAAKKAPMSLNAGSGSATYNIATEWLLSLADARATIVNYGGSAPTITALAGGQTDFTIVEYSAALSLVKAGKIRLLAMTIDNRFHAEPDTPTLQELGYKDFFQVAWWGIFAPANTPNDVVSRLEKTSLEICEDQQTKTWLEQHNYSQFCGSAQELHRFQKSEIERETRLVKQFKIPQI